MLRILCLSLVVAVAACGGRVAKPVSETRVTDDRLSCQHIAAETEVNETRILDLASESEFANQNNAAKVLGGVATLLFLDLSDSEQQEIAALQSRNKRLAALARSQNCPS